MADVAELQADRYRIAARIERLPFSRWHLKMGAIVSTGWFFDGFDALAIAYVLPVLLQTWHLSFTYIGLMIGAGYAGQLVGSIVFGWLGERVGRVPIFRYTLILYTVMSLACAFAWDFTSLFWMRAIQGLGLGGEILIMASYIGEFARASHRGRYGLGFQLWFSISFIFVSGISYFVVPELGWQAMFLIGALPAVILIPLRRWMPESPRWLVTKGRDEEANTILTKIENDISEHGAKPLPPVLGRNAGTPFDRDDRRSVARHLSPPHPRCVDDLVLHLHHCLWPQHDGADDAAHRLPRDPPAIDRLRLLLGRRRALLHDHRHLLHR